MKDNKENIDKVKPSEKVNEDEKDSGRVATPARNETTEATRNQPLNTGDTANPSRHGLYDNDDTKHNGGAEIG